jgi:carbamoyltransferase
MKILGLSCYYHDAAAALVVDGQVVAAAEEERFTRVKHDNRFPAESIRFCLEQAGISVHDLDGVAFYEKPLSKFHRMARTAQAFPPARVDGYTDRLVRLRHEGLEIERHFRDAFVYDGPFWFVEHHVSHAASAFFCSPFERATVVTIDGVGELATTTIARGDGHRLETLCEIHYPHSLGLFYGAITAFLGFEVNSDEYKVMGLASYGTPAFMNEMDRLLEVKDDGSFALDLDYFAFYADDRIMYSPKFRELFGEPHPPGATAGQRQMNIAASAQRKLEQAVHALLAEAHRRTGESNLCLAGGVALNGVANWRGFQESPFTDLFVQPAAGDSGGAIGAALYACHERQAARQIRTLPFSPYLGPGFEEEDIVRALKAHGLAYTRMDDDALVEAVAERVAGDQIVGWFQGRMEVGPRALGGRSILANPANASMKDTINACVKFREEFRPFAPAVLEERAEEFFELDGHAAPYMLLVTDAKPGAAERIPAVVHVDNTARVQTVSAANHPRFHALLSALDRATGTPVVLNTSFNVKGEPIVCTPTDAIRCFLNTDLDVLALDNYLVEKGI